MSNTSATGGYLLPTSSEPLPGHLSLEDFIQTVISGVSGVAGNLVRPKWQIAPPKNPDIYTNWVAFAIVQVTPDANAYANTLTDASTLLARMERLEIQVSFFGPQALEIYSVFRDGFQIQQNLENLRAANMGFNGVSQAIRGPDLINQRYVDRWETSLTLMRFVQRVYPVLSFASAAGVIHTVVDGNNYAQSFKVNEE